MFSTRGLRFQPRLGQILVCDFKGLREPEMVKVRPVIVVSPKPRIQKGICTVVPMSRQKPNFVKPFHYKLPNKTIPGRTGEESWAKCDMIYTVSLKRLDRLKCFGKYIVPQLSASEISEIQKCLLSRPRDAPLDISFLM